MSQMSRNGQQSRRMYQERRRKKSRGCKFLCDVVFKTESSEYSRSWCLDSGATSHLTNDMKVFTKINTSDGGNVRLANNSNVHIEASGIAKISAHIHRESKNFILNNTLYVSDLRLNLASVAKITDHDFKIVFSKEKVKAVDYNGCVKMIADRVTCISCANQHKSYRISLLKNHQTNQIRNRLADHQPKYGTGDSAI